MNIAQQHNKTLTGTSAAQPANSLALSVLSVMVRDLNGVEVNIGDNVTVLNVDHSVLGKLQPNEKVRVESMIGEVFEVYEIDEHGQAWVEKWWNHGGNESTSHSLGLSSMNMQVAKSDR